MKFIDAVDAMVNLERVVAAVKGQDVQESKFAKALATLETLARKEGIPLAIVGGLAAIHHGYERFTKDIDVVVRSANLNVLTRVAPQYGVKVIWNDPEGWHKLQCEGVPVDVVPEGRKPRKDAPTTIPGPEQLGVRDGTGYAGIAGWIETKLGSFREQDRADVVQVIKVTTPATLTRIRKHLGKAHSIYLRRFDELVEAAREEMDQECERGGGVLNAEAGMSDNRILEELDKANAAAQPLAFEDERLNWDEYLEKPPPPRRSGTIRVQLQRVGRSKPIPVPKAGA